MHLRHIPKMVLIATCIAVLSGCGEKTLTAPEESKLAASQGCIDCHQGWNSPGTLKPIADEWKKSTHNTSNGAGCADCHEPEVGHPDSCNLCHGGTPPGGLASSANHVSVNPDRDGKCRKCHRKETSWGISVYDGVPVDNQFVHYSTGTRANYVATGYVNYCRKCHNPHDPTTAREISQQWSRSGLGNTRSPARISADFKARGSSVPAQDSFASQCVRCHTSSGFLAYVASGFSDIRALPDSDGVRGDTAVTPNPRTTYLDKSREGINCDVCHSDGRTTDGSAYSYKVRGVPPVTAYFNYSSAPLHQSAWNVKLRRLYPDFGLSNNCVVCHTGREIGLIITAASQQGMDFSNQTLIASHYRSAASTLTATSGFHFYSSAEKYRNRAYFQHDRIGTASSSPVYAGGSSGPCIGCHMKNGRSHYFLSVQKTSGVITAIPSDAQTCSTCHASSNAYIVPWTPAALDAKRAGFQAALGVLQQMILHPNHDAANALGTYNSASGTIKYSGKKWNVPLFSPDPARGNPPISVGAYTMGAAFNYETLRGDPGAYAHNSVYVRRLVYDSIDWLNDGVMNQDVKAAFDYLKNSGYITAGSAAGMYEMALAYLCGSQSDQSGVTGARP